MDFSHYTDEPVALAIDLVNTDQRSFDGSDRLAELDDLRGFLSRWSHLWEGEPPDPTPGDLVAIRALRDRLRDVFEAGTVEEAAAGVNAVLAENLAIPRVATHGSGPHLHFEPVDGSIAVRVSVLTAMALATVVVEHGIERFGTCAAETCDDVFVDTSRNRSRRHCSTTCSTREHVAAYRRRRSGHE